MKYTLLFLMAALAGCGEQNDKPSKAMQADIENCRKIGGLPILSIWDDRLADCIFSDKGKELSK